MISWTIIIPAILLGLIIGGLLGTWLGICLMDRAERCGKQRAQEIIERWYK